jgi:hypothetical protein
MQSKTTDMIRVLDEEMRTFKRRTKRNLKKLKKKIRKENELRDLKIESIKELLKKDIDELHTKKPEPQVSRNTFFAENKGTRKLITRLPHRMRKYAIFSDMIYQPALIPETHSAHTILETMIDRVGQVQKEIKPFVVEEATRDFAAFKNPITKEIVIAIAGTRFGEEEGISDILTNPHIVFKNLEKSYRYRQARGFINSIRRRFRNYNIVVTGHSLGGRIAEGYGRENPDVKVVVFNTPGTFELHELDRKNPVKYRNIYSFTIDGDIMSIKSTGGKEYMMYKRPSMPKTLVGHHSIENFVGGAVHDIIDYVKERFKRHLDV